jgi:monoterpene epsilon-lactone hydrolase
MSPWTDLALTGDSIATRSSADPLITRDALEKAAQLYLGGQDLCDAQASPLYGDLTGLPPVRLVVQYSLIYVERFWVDASKA